MTPTIKAVASGNSNDPTKWQETATTAVVSITALTKLVVLSGDVRSSYPAGTLFTLVGTDVAMDDGAYEVESVAAALVGGNTVITTVVAPAADDITAAGTSSINRVPTANDSADLNGKTITQVGALEWLSLEDSQGNESFVVTDDFACGSESTPCTVRIKCITTKDGNVPIQLDVYVVKNESYLLDNTGLVDIGNSSFMGDTGMATTCMSNYGGIIIGNKLTFTCAGDGLYNSGTVECDEIEGSNGYSDGSVIENVGVITAALITVTDLNSYEPVISNGGTITVTLINATSSSESESGCAVINNTSSGVITAGFETEAENFTTNFRWMYNEGIINLIGKLGNGIIENSGSVDYLIQSKYSTPPSDIIGAGML